jgi:hypothetical protein
MGIEYTNLVRLSSSLLQFGLFVVYTERMRDGQELITQLFDAGWTYASIADEMGVHWHTVKRWHNGESRASRATFIGLATLLEKSPPPKRRYGAEAPQRRPRKGPATA